MSMLTDISYLIHNKYSMICGFDKLAWLRLISSMQMPASQQAIEQAFISNIHVSVEGSYLYFVSLK